ncbi:hypothetical protein [Undibacterium sp.]|uniref:hypothetical protein n=1 Tax=Undibacterium sp. TaxID=1914977 RepID=UPI002D159AD5|nr:hypothetical protein [Undibacterium sp.]HTD03099.1 hypothetical protein [Undibacterium sp.]
MFQGARQASKATGERWRMAGDGGAVVQAVTSLGYALNLSVIAEGVQSRTQADFLP